MDTRLIQQQTQRLVLSPQIRQYLRLLQLPQTELQQAVETELALNPVLEERITESSDLADTKKRESEDAFRELLPGKSFDTFERMDENFRESQSPPDFSRSRKEDLQELHNYQETLVTRADTLSDFLLAQSQLLDLSAIEKQLAAEIIGNIDENGYLRSSSEEISSRCGVSPEEAELVLSKIQQLDPAGVGARNLPECLRLQLDRQIRDSQTSKPAATKLARLIIEGHLPLLEKRDYSSLAKAFDCDISDVRNAVEIIAKLDPQPARGFQDQSSVAVTPDAAIYFDEDHPGKFIVEIFDEKVPEIQINPYYRKMLRQKNLDEPTKNYLKEKIQSAMNFMQALHLRKSTLREITEAITEEQNQFLEKGFLHLKPLRLKDVANKIGVHESTVSRAIQGKYVLTPQGMIPYKSFFSTRMETSEGPAESQKSIMEKIKFMIDKEDPKSPLSDQEIVEKVKQDGILIARRTVAKYRDLLKIMPSHMRRRR